MRRSGRSGALWTCKVRAALLHLRHVAAALSSSFIGFISVRATPFQHSRQCDQAVAAVECLRAAKLEIYRGSRPIQRRATCFGLEVLSTASLTRRIPAAASFRCRLNASEIRADIQAMERPFKEHPHKQSSPPTIRYNNGVLLFRRLRFRVGDSIVIEEKDGENDPIVWFLKTISDVEVVRYVPSIMHPAL